MQPYDWQFGNPLRHTYHGPKAALEQTPITEYEFEGEPDPEIIEILNEYGIGVRPTMKVCACCFRRFPLKEFPLIKAQAYNRCPQVRVGEICKRCLKQTSIISSSKKI